MSIVKWGEWVENNEFYVQWKRDTPFSDGCTRDMSHRIQAFTPRLIVDDGRGPSRDPRHHGKKNSYICEACASAEGFSEQPKVYGYGSLI
jgi:hypothetical protein